MGRRRYEIQAPDGIGPWRVTLEHPVEFQSPILARKRDVRLDPDKFQFLFETKLDVQLTTDVTTMLEVEKRISVSVGLRSVDCSTGPLAVVRSRGNGAQENADDTTINRDIPNYRTFCSRVDLSLVPVDVNSRDFNVVPGRSSVNQIREKKMSSDEQLLTAYVKKEGSPEDYVGRTQSSVWNYSLVKSRKYGFFWDLGFASDQVVAAGRKISTFRRVSSCINSSRRRIVGQRKNFPQQPWRSVISTDSMWNIVKFGSDIYPDTIDWNFSRKLENSTIPWVMDIELSIQIVRTPKNVKSDLSIVEEIPVSLKVNFNHNI